MNLNFPRALLILLIPLLLLFSCAPQANPSAEVEVLERARLNDKVPPGFAVADGSRPLTFPEDFGAHPDFRTEWWYYIGNLDAPDERHFGFELTIFRVGLLPPTVELPDDSQWYDRSLSFAHFALSDIAGKQFYAFERYARPGPGSGLAGAQADPYHVWLEDWSITQQEPGVYHMQVAQEGIALDLTLSDEMGVILHGEEGYSRKGKEASNASYYYSQPRLRAEGTIKIEGEPTTVSGLAWKDHEFSTSVLDDEQIGWDWFSLQFEDGKALMLFQLRELDGAVSSSSSGTFISENGSSQNLKKADFAITVLDEWLSPRSGGLYPSTWEVRLDKPICLLQIKPWMADQELNFPSVTYWEGAVRFEGECEGAPVRGNGYVELTGYAGNVPLR